MKIRVQPLNDIEMRHYDLEALDRYGSPALKAAVESVGIEQALQDPQLLGLLRRAANPRRGDDFAGIGLRLWSPTNSSSPNTWSV